VPAWCNGAIQLNFNDESVFTELCVIPPMQLLIGRKFPVIVGAGIMKPTVSAHVVGQIAVLVLKAAVMKPLIMVPEAVE